MPGFGTNLADALAANWEAVARATWRRSRRWRLSRDWRRGSTTHLTQWFRGAEARARNGLRGVLGPLCPHGHGWRFVVGISLKRKNATSRRGPTRYFCMAVRRAWRSVSRHAVGAGAKAVGFARLSYMLSVETRTTRSCWLTPPKSQLADGRVLLAMGWTTALARERSGATKFWHGSREPEWRVHVK